MNVFDGIAQYGANCEGAAQADPPFYLESIRNSVEGGAKRITAPGLVEWAEVVGVSCRCRFCQRCAVSLGIALREKLVAVFDTFRRVYTVTLTMDPELLGSPEASHDYLRERRAVAEFVRNLRKRAKRQKRLPGLLEKAGRADRAAIDAVVRWADRNAQWRERAMAARGPKTRENAWARAGAAYAKYQRAVERSKKTGRRVAALANEWKAERKNLFDLASARWAVIVEFQEDTEMPHYHLVLDAEFIPFTVLCEEWAKLRPAEVWPRQQKRPLMGSVRFTVREGFQSAKHAANYCVKYLTKPPRHGWPTWVLDYTGQMRRFSTSRGFFGDSETHDHLDADGEPRPARTIRQRVEACRITSAVLWYRGEPDGNGRVAVRRMAAIFDTPDEVFNRERLGAMQGGRLVITEPAQLATLADLIRPPGLEGPDPRAVVAAVEEHRRWWDTLNDTEKIRLTLEGGPAKTQAYKTFRGARAP